MNCFTQLYCETNLVRLEHVLVVSIGRSTRAEIRQLRSSYTKGFQAF